MKLKILALALVGFLATGCASFYRHSADDIAVGNEQIQFISDPQYSKIEVEDLNLRQVIYKGETPVRLELKTGAKYNEGKVYQVTFSKPGYKTTKIILKGIPDEKYYKAGNIFFGSLVGWAVVDPITGAAWTLKHNSNDKRVEKVSHDVLKITFPKL